MQAPARGTLGRVYPGSRGSEKHSPDSACSVDYSSSRLSSPEHPNEGEGAALREVSGPRWEWRLWRWWVQRDASLPSPHPDSESTEPLSVDGISSDLEEPAEGDEEEEEEEGGTGSYGLQEGSPHTPDQEQFLKQHFETLANGAAPGVVRGPVCGHCSPPFFPPSLAEREGPRAGHALGLPSRGGRIWGEGLLQFMISVPW